MLRARRYESDKAFSELESFSLNLALKSPAFPPSYLTALFQCRLPL
jgi:hypothetical protein